MKRAELIMESMVGISEKIFLKLSQLKNEGRDEDLAKLIGVISAPFVQFEIASGINNLDLDSDVVETLFIQSMEACIMAKEIMSQDLGDEVKGLALSSLGIMGA